MRKKRLDPGLWKWHERPRVLIEDPDLESGLEIAWALRDAGYAVAICRGPEPDEFCPLVGPDDCALVVGADAVVAGLGPEVEGGIRQRHPGKPIIAPGPPAEVVAAVGRALAKQ